MNENELFLNYKKLPTIFSEKVWNIIRIFSILVLISLILLLYFQNKTGLFLFWRLIIPIVPLFLFLSTGIWRNICAVAALNQLPRNLGFAKGDKIWNWSKKYGFIVACTLLLVFVTARKFLFNTNANALIILLLFLGISSFIMGIFYKGKSGWCNTFCPVMPVERLYGHSPFFNVRNCYMDCIGCTKNCFDVCPDIAFLKDLYDKDPFFYNSRKFFAGLFPGFIAGFYLIPDPPQIPIHIMYLYFALYSSVSLISMYLLGFTFFKRKAGLLISIFGILALNTFYWFNVPIYVEIFTSSKSILIIALIWLIKLLIFTLTIIWLKKSYIKESVYQKKYIKKK